MKGKIQILASGLIFITLMSSGCLDNAEEVSLKIPEEDVGVPEITGVFVDDGGVTLTWSKVDNASSYVVYRSTLLGGERRIAETADTVYADSGLINGTEYYYAIAGKGPHGLEGDRTDWLVAVPSVYSISINQGAGYTNSVNVTIYPSAPANTSLMMISNNSDFSGAGWENFVSTRNWVLIAGDGEKEVYAKFQDSSGGISSTVSNSIILDTFCGISSIDITPESVLFSPGDIIHFTMHVEDDETGGTGIVMIENYSESVSLYDNGRGGDSNAEDGVYECDFRTPMSLRGKDLLVSGVFMDRAGNESGLFEAEDRISFTDPPQPVELIGASDSTTNSITIKWVASDEENFRSYVIYRDTVSHTIEDFESPDYMVQELFNQGQTGYPDSDLEEGVQYFYRIYVVNDMEETAGSNEISASTYDAIPNAVILDTLSAIGPDRVTLNWTVNQNSDFAEYRIYRSTSPGVTLSTGTNIAVIENREITWYDDIGIDLSSDDYYYRVYVYDRGGNYSRSNEESTAE